MKVQVSKHLAFTNQECSALVAALLLAAHHQSSSLSSLCCCFFFFFLCSTLFTSMTSKKQQGDWSGGDGILPGRAVLGPLVLMLTTPVFSIVFYHVVAHLDSNFWAFLIMIQKHGFCTTVYSIWPSPWDAVTWKLITSFLAFELLLQKFLPGQQFEATVTPKGNRPVYTANGMAAYLVTLATLLLGTYLGYFYPALVFDKFGNILSSMNVFALLFCAMLLIKGHVAPSSTDSGSNGSVVMDYYWGMELYPRILGWDVKMFTNCRAGMMFWAVGILCFAHKNMQLHGGTLQLGMAVNVALQLIYITKFFYWYVVLVCMYVCISYYIYNANMIIYLYREMGYMCSMVC
jgi:7-dehydrocholesterol reductase